MSRRSWQAATLLPAIVTMGLTAGFFLAWDVSVMPGLADLDDRAFVGSFQLLDRAIMTSALFMPAFIGALAFTGVAAVLYLRADGRAPLPWVALAFGLYLATVVITMAVHEPLNHVLRTAGDPDQIVDLAAARETFQEIRWSSWNIVRTVATTAAFGCLARALLVHGRAAGDPAGRRSRPTSAAPVHRLERLHDRGHALRPPRRCGQAAVEPSGSAWGIPEHGGDAQGLSDQRCNWR